MNDYTEEIDNYLKRLFPITRSITGDGNRETLKILQEIIPLEIKEYPSGQKVFDWTIPKEWNIIDAWIKNSKGDKIVDFKKNNLHIVSYSIPIHKKFKLRELKEHLHYRKELPEAIPYRTTYYKETWGFCLNYNDFKKYFNEDEEYVVFIDSNLIDGSLSLGELVLPGRTSKEYLISTYICHPSLANDNLSGMILTAFLAKELLNRKLNFSYRIIFVPETIGAIVYCANNIVAMKKIDCGFVVTTVGGPGKFSYKQSFDKTYKINKLIEHVFYNNKIDFITYPFDVHGSDERQYSSPGLRINIATLCKDRYYEYKEYHTSLDNLDFVKSKNILRSFDLYLQVLDLLDKDIVCKSNFPNCEVMLSKYKLYPQKGGAQLPSTSKKNELDIILWLFFYCDGNFSLLEIADKLQIDFNLVSEVANKLIAKKLLENIYE